MPTLGTVIPRLTEDATNRACSAYRLRNCKVVALKLTTGAPCSSRSELFASWPGPEEDIKRWYLLETGHAVGEGVDEYGNSIFPVVKLDGD